MMFEHGHAGTPLAQSPRSSVAAWTVVEVVFAVLSVLLLAGVAFPAFLKTRPQRQAKTCARHLDDIAVASRRYAIERGCFPPSFSDLTPAFLPTVPTCPAGGVYALGSPEGDPPVCSVHSIQPVTGVLP